MENHHFDHQMDGYPTPAIHGASFGAAQQGAPGFGPQVPQHDQRLGRRLEPRLGSVDGSWMDHGWIILIWGWVKTQ